MRSPRSGAAAPSRARWPIGAPGRRCRTVIAIAFLGASGVASVQAAVWGYIDADGKAHVATEKLDERYQLFFRGKSEGELAADAAARAAPSLDPAFAATPIFRRVETHPNVRRFEPLIARHAAAYGVDAALVKAVVAVESAYEVRAVSQRGAIGLMQVIPETAERYGVTGDARGSVEQKLLDPAVNIRIGTRYLKDLLERFAGDTVLALAAYNAGEASVEHYGSQVPPFPETREFVRLVLQFHEWYKPPPPPPPPPLRVTIPRRPAPAR